MPPHTQPQAVRAEASALDPALRARLLGAVEAAGASWCFGDLFSAAPEWNEAYRSLNFRTEYYNRLVGVPFYTALAWPFL